MTPELLLTISMSEDKTVCELLCFCLRVYHLLNCCLFFASLLVNDVFCGMALPRRAPCESLLVGRYRTDRFAFSLKTGFCVIPITQLKAPYYAKYDVSLVRR